MARLLLRLAIAVVNTAALVFAYWLGYYTGVDEQGRAGYEWQDAQAGNEP